MKCAIAFIRIKYFAGIGSKIKQNLSLVPMPQIEREKQNLVSAEDLLIFKVVIQIL